MEATQVHTHTHTHKQSLKPTVTHTFISYKYISITDYLHQVWGRGQGFYEEALDLSDYWDRNSARTRVLVSWPRAYEYHHSAILQHHKTSTNNIKFYTA